MVSLRPLSKKHPSSPKCIYTQRGVTYTAHWPLIDIAGCQQQQRGYGTATQVPKQCQVPATTAPVLDAFHRATYIIPTPTASRLHLPPQLSSTPHHHAFELIHYQSNTMYYNYPSFHSSSTHPASPATGGATAQRVTPALPSGHGLTNSPQIGPPHKARHINYRNYAIT